ncbi:unnamed protein product, partial [Prorocentrum cordatum]
RSRSRDRRRQDKGRDDEAAAAAAAADMAEEERQRDLDEDEEERRRLAEQETKMARTVMLTSLTHRSDERDIYEFFSTGAGTVRDVQIIRDARTGRSRGVAYVEMSTGEAGRDAKPDIASLGLRRHAFFFNPNVFLPISVLEGLCGAPGPSTDLGRTCTPREAVGTSWAAV